MPRYTEDDITQAIRDVANGKGIRAAAREWGFPILHFEVELKAVKTIPMQQKVSKGYQGFKKTI